MKKLQFILMALVTIVLPTILVACGDDDDNDLPDNSGAVPVKAQATFKMQPNQEMNDMLQMTVTYLRNGAYTTQILHNTMNLIYVENQIPATFAVRVDCQLKDGVELTKESYNFMLSVTTLNYHLYDKNGKAIDKYTHETPMAEEGMTLTKDELAEKGSFTIYSNAYEVLGDGSYNILQDYE
ncbi:MAG: hypothetical protein ACI4AK_02045 [Lepagella sp.]